MPIHYININKNYYISTNYKAWFSTFEKQPSLKRASLRDIVTNNKTDIAKHYLFVRNPYSKLESFFKSKLRKHPQKVTFSNDFVWQDSQKIFFPFLGLDPNSEFDVVKEKLLSISFRKFIELLPKIYTSDPHLTPQCFAHIVYIYQDKKAIDIGFDRYLKAELQDDIHFLENVLDFNVSIRKNSTKDISKDEVKWDRNLYNIVNSIYDTDFILFEYQKN